MMRHMVGRTAEVRPEKQSKKAESCSENLWNEIQLKEPQRQKRTQEQKRKTTDGLYILAEGLSAYRLRKEQFLFDPSATRPHGLTFTWWGCCGLCL